MRTSNKEDIAQSKAMLDTNVNQQLDKDQKEVEKIKVLIQKYHQDMEFQSS